MAKKPGFDDIQTALQRPPPGYEAGPLRSPFDVRWSDASGAHTMAVDGRVVVGSASGAGLVLVDPAASRIHAELELRDDGLWIRDLGSRNGTFVESVQVAVARVPDGGRVRIGATVLVAQRAARPAAVALWPHDRFGPLIGRSAAMRELFARLSRVAPTESTVLIQGETGTGKELVARAIHEASSRPRGPLIVVDCAALPDTLLEAELFGHAKGAFTGAVAARAGALEAAEGGTVFLDEIGELPLAMQPKLLRVLESRALRRLGETSQRTVDVRFLSATHRDLREMVNKGAFREDLYFRLSVLPVLVPPLRDRPEDIGALIEHFVPEGSRAELGPELVGEVLKRPWLGNVRELRNFVERVVAFGAQQALALTPSAPQPKSTPGEGVWRALEAALDRPLPEAREAWMEGLEREYLRRLLDKHGRNVAQAAQAAGVDRTYIYRLIRKHDL